MEIFTCKKRFVIFLVLQWSLVSADGRIEKKAVVRQCLEALEILQKSCMKPYTTHFDGIAFVQRKTIHICQELSRVLEVCLPTLAQEVTVLTLHCIFFFFLI